jgi:hypothetical protein
MKTTLWDVDHVAPKNQAVAKVMAVAVPAVAIG